MLMFWLFYFGLVRPIIKNIAIWASDPIETLRIAFEADFSDFVKEVDEQLEDTKEKLKETGEGADDAGTKLTGLGAIKLGGLIAAGQAVFNVIMKIAQAIPSIAINLAQGAVAANAQFETFETQFTTLLGSTDMAKARLEDLARFGVETPFELPEVVEASRLLQTFGGDALAATENLRMVGDLAAGVNQPFQSLAFWIGRLYSALQGGQPFGEAAMRLQEMGVLTPELRQEMEGLQKSGADGVEIWARFSEVAGGKFAGNMDRLSKTFQGVMSNLADLQGHLLRVGGAPFFEVVRDSAIEFLDILNENQAELEMIATAIGDLAAMVLGDLRAALMGALEGDNLNKVISRIAEALESAGEFYRLFRVIAGQLRISGGLLKTIGAEIKILQSLPWLGNWIAGTATFNERLTGVAMGLGIIKAAFAALGAAVEPMVNWLKSFMGTLGNLLTGDIAGAMESAKQAVKDLEGGLINTEAAGQAWRNSILQTADDINNALNPALDETEEKAKEIKAEFTGDPAEVPFAKEAEALDKFSTQMIEAARNRDMRLEQAAKAHGERQIKIIEDFEKAQAKLRIDMQKEADEAIADAQKELAELSSDTDKELAERRDEFNRQEQRETEDHLAEMRRIEDRYMSDLKDAVAARDAVAIVRLRERHAQESREKEEAFSKRQGREREDNDRELQEIRNKEAEKRAAINEELEIELQEILAKEAEKQAALEERRNEQLMANDANLAAQQQQIEDSMARQLETIARNMADQKEISEEGARQVLEAFSEVFGVNGDIDKMMADFVKRRELRATITMNFEGRRGQALAESSVVSQEAAAGAALGGQLGNIIGAGGSFGSIRPFAEGGSGIIDKPTLALMGEKEPEFYNIIPMSKLAAGGFNDEMSGRFQLDITGSAPPGMGTADVDRVAHIVLMALRQAGVLSTRGG